MNQLPSPCHRIAPPRRPGRPGVHLAALFFLCLAATCHAQSNDIPTQQVTGTIRIWGSPQMADLLRLYEAAFHTLQPTIRFEDDLKSTLTAVPGVYTAQADIGLLGREIWPTEIQAFTAQTGHSPRVIDIATGSYDIPKATFALMIFVSRTNPIASLSTLQLARIFSGHNPIRTWGELGLTGAWASRPVHLYGFNIDNDKSQIFAHIIFAKGEHWSPALREFGNAANGKDAGALILQAAAQDPDSIAISNVHYATPEVRMVPLSTPDHSDPIAPTRAHIQSRLYPLTRAVFMVVNPAHTTPATAEFLRFVLSRQGAQAVAEEGNYLPLPGEIATRQQQVVR
jgi:phosphate transport system substrate-binding protein